MSLEPESDPSAVASLGEAEVEHASVLLGELARASIAHRFDVAPNPCVGAAVLSDGVEIGRWGSVLLGAAVLALANTFVKPVLTILTFPIILFTLGLFYFVLNVAMLALAEWIAPEFSINGFWTYVGATIVVWLVNWALYALFERMNRGRSVVV